MSPLYVYFLAFSFYLIFFVDNPTFVGLVLPSCPVAQLSNSCGTVKPKYSEGPRDWYNLFAIKRSRYGEVLFHIINIVLSVFVILCYIDRGSLYRSSTVCNLHDFLSSWHLD